MKTEVQFRIYKCIIFLFLFLSFSSLTFPLSHVFPCHHFPSTPFPATLSFSLSLCLKLIFLYMCTVEGDMYPNTQPLAMVSGSCI